MDPKRSPDTGESSEATTEQTTRELRRSSSGSGSGGGPPWSRPAFEPGAVLADRYRIVRFLARGGMGEVYEADDVELGARVALKSIAPDVAADARMVARLKREVLLARKVTHPNVCRLHDVGSHAGPYGPIVFLTMDLLAGETLADRLSRGRTPTREALPLVRQMAAALDAAHVAGVVHRDFKTRNVMLVSEPGGSARAVVMDFGIAVPAATDDDVAEESGEGRFIGTPAYMAPEQVTGGAITRQTDVYALGVVMFEMVTGSMPFESKKALEVISMRLTQPPPAPRSRVPALDRRWNDAILRCLAREPSDRFARAGDAADALAEPPPRASRRAVMVAALFVALSLVLATAVYVRRAKDAAGTSPESTQGAPGSRRTSVSVLALKNLTGRADVQWMSAALGEMIGTELSAGESLRVLPGERVAQATRELSLGDAPTLSADALARLSANLGTDYVVSGSYVVEGEGARADVVLADARNGKTLGRIARAAPTSRLPDIATALGAKIRQELGAKDPTAGQEQTARAAMASDPRALEAYAEGQSRLRLSDLAGARDAFERAVAADPAYPLAHVGLSAALSSLGDDARSYDEAKVAFESSRALSREEQLVIEARFRMAAKEWARAADIYRTLFDFFPDNLDYGWRYGNALDNGDEPAKALAVIDELHELPPPEGDDPRIDVLESVAADHVADQHRALAAALAAVPKARARGMTTTEADAHLNVGEAYWGLDDVDRALPELEMAKSLYERLDDKRELSSALAGIAGIRAQRGEPAAALPDIERAVSLAREAGDRFHTGVRLRRLADTREEVGEIREARPLWIEAEGLFQTVHDERDGARLEGRLGRASAADGDTKGARDAFTAARARESAIGSRDEVMSLTVEIAELALDTGDLASAEREAPAAAALARELSDRYYAGAAALTLARAAREKGDAAGCLRAAEEASASFEAAQVGFGKIEVKLLLAAASLDEGRAEGAEPLARDALAALHAGGYRGHEAAAQALVSRILLAEGKLDAATSALDAADALAPEAVATQIDLALARGAVLAASPEGCASAATTLADARARAEKAGLAPRAWEARVLLARLAPRTERAAALAAVAADARARGYARIARLCR